MADDGERPIIIKKVKKGGHGHHGGAWKVAYADFVTAMMAFFLLLWLLSSTTEEQREGIADYFTPTVGLRDEMGIGFEGGISPMDKGEKKSDKMPPGIVFGAPPAGEIIKDPVIVEQEYVEETEEFKKVQGKIEAMLKENSKFGEFQKNLMIDQTPEGLRIQLVDEGEFSMFEPGSARLSERAKELLRQLTPILVGLPNRLSITGHTDSSKYGIDVAYGNWELSADRANSTRRFLNAQKGVKDNKIVVVIGKADKELLVPQEPLSPRNRRISIILLRKYIYPYEVPAPEELLAPPKVEQPQMPSPAAQTQAKPGSDKTKAKPTETEH